MKKAFAPILFLFLSYMASGQDNSSPASKLTVGIQAGISASAESPLFPDEEALLGINPMITVQYNFTPHFSLRTGLGLQQQGYYFSEPILTSSSIDPKTGFPNANGSIINQFTVNYGMLPIMAKYKFGNDRFGFFVEGGPYVAYMASASQFIRVNDSTGTHVFTNNVTNEYKRVDIGASLGIGLEKSITEHLGLILEISGNFGFSDIMNRSSSFEPPFTTNQSANLLLGLTWKMASAS